MVCLFSKNFEYSDITTVLFDKDGTFLDDNIYWGKLSELRIETIIKAFKLNQKLFKGLCFAIGYNPIQCKLIPNGPVGTLSRNEVINFMVQELKKYNVETTFEQISCLFDKVHIEFLNNMAKYIEFIKFSEDFIYQLKDKKVRMAVVTSDNCEHTYKTLKIMGLEDCFELVIGKDSCEYSKKTGEPALLAIKKLNVDKDKTLVIGDALMDYQMAENAGLKSILVATGQTDIGILKKYTKNVVNNLSEVLIK